MKTITQTFTSVTFALLILVGITSTAYAGGSLGGYYRITAMTVPTNSSTHIIVSFESSMTGQPSCVSSSNRNKIIFDATTTKGKNQNTLLTAAFLSGRKVKVTGTGSCALDVEKLKWMVVID
jgi:hypothetical protein